MGKKSGNPRRKLHHCNRRDYQYVTFYVLGFAFCAWLYSLTLEGGDVKFIKDHLTVFGAYMAGCVAGTASLTVYALFFAKKINLIARCLGPVLGWIILLQVALSDLNTTLVSHGQYNLTGFVVLLSGSLTIVFSYKFCVFLRSQLNSRLFWGGTATILIVSCTLYYVKSVEVIENWNKGLGAALEYEWENCDIELRGTPWPGIFPDGTFNFLLGSDSCPAVDSFSSFSNGELKLQCALGYATIVENPDFLGPHVDDFILEETGLAA